MGSRLKNALASVTVSELVVAVDVVFVAASAAVESHALRTPQQACPHTHAMMFASEAFCLKSGDVP